jgi:hypothetical protein
MLSREISGWQLFYIQNKRMLQHQQLCAADDHPRDVENQGVTGGAMLRDAYSTRFSCQISVFGAPTHANKHELT